jgi:HAAS
VSATTALPPDVDAYLAAVRAALGDLPAAERDDLLAEVEVSLLDAASEGGPIAARLGPPEEFAAELRAAAGFEQSEVRPSADRSLTRRLRSVTGWWTGAQAAGARRVLAELAPIWWVVRGYVAVAIVALALDAGWSSALPFVPRVGGTNGGVAVVALAILASVALGLAGRRRPGMHALAVAANVALAVAAVPVLAYVVDRIPENLAAPPIVVVQTASAPAGLWSRGVAVDNVYPYSRDGKLLHDVLLYDGSGRPIDVRPFTPDPSRRVPVTATGLALYNAFPIRYFEPGTTVVADPDAGPPVTVPQLVTPPLESGSTP